MFAKWLAAAAAVLALGLSSKAAGRPFTVDDLLGQETLGQRVIDPTGRWLVFERRDPYETADRFDRDGAMGAALSRLQVVDLARPGAAQPLLNGDDARGVNLLAFSPGGRRLAVARLYGDSWTLGLAEMRSGAVRWLPITPEDPPSGRTLMWLSDDRLLVLDRPDGTPPWYLRNGAASAKGLPPLWAASARGDVGRTVVGSGVYRDIRAHRPPNRLLRVDVASGRLEAMAEGELFDVEIAPDGRRVALLAFDGDRQPRQDGPAQGAAGTSTRTATLLLVDLATGQTEQPLAGLDLLPSLLTWSSDSRALLVFARPRGADWTAGRIQRVDAASGQATPLAPALEPRLDFRPEMVRAGWMGPVPVAYARPRGATSRAYEWRRLDDGRVLTERLPDGERDLLAADPHGITVRVGTTVWRVDPEGRARRLPLQAVMRAPVVTGVYAPRLDAQLPAGAWVEAGPPGSRFRIWLAGGAGRAVGQPPTGAREVLAVSPVAGAAMLRDTDARGVETLSVQSGRGAPVEIARLNAQLVATDAPEVRPVHHLGPGGEAFTSWLYLPPGANDRPPPPLVVRPYSGASYSKPPREFFGEKGFMTDLRMLVGHGFAVLVPSLPLPQVGDPMAGLGKRILAIADAAAQDPALAGAFDPERLALWGHSYGGYTVMAAIGQTDRFRAAVSIAGYSEMISKWATLPAIHRVATDEDMRVNWSLGSVEQGQGGMRVPPWSDPERYRRNSPLMSADRVRTPLLMAHGDQDIIPLPQSEAMFAALYRQDKDAILLTYFGEGHGLRSPGNVRDFYAQAFKFLDERLGFQPSQRCARVASGIRVCQ